MSALARILEQFPKRHLATTVRFASTAETQGEKDEFLALNIYQSRDRLTQRKKYTPPPVSPPRTEQMKIDQDWGSVWPGPRSFHPATVPLPLRQGYVDKGAAPHKFGNAELMKIPNFLHLTPPVIERQCKALKKFCTSWPKALSTDEKCEKHFPITVTSSTYCHSSPTIRDPMARIVTIKLKLSTLELDKHAKDKLLRLVGDRYDETTDVLTIVADKCPLKKQNYEYAMYLLTALYHEAWTTEPWEAQKSEADMEYYDWTKSASRKSVETLFGTSIENIPNIEEYRKSTDAVMNEGESDYTINNYGSAVRKLLNLPTL